MALLRIYRVLKGTESAVHMQLHCFYSLKPHLHVMSVVNVGMYIVTTLMGHRKSGLNREVVSIRQVKIVWVYAVDSLLDRFHTKMNPYSAHCVKSSGKFGPPLNIYFTEYAEF